MSEKQNPPEETTYERVETSQGETEAPAEEASDDSNTFSDIASHDENADSVGDMLGGQQGEVVYDQKPEVRYAPGEERPDEGREEKPSEDEPAEELKPAEKLVEEPAEAAKPAEIAQAKPAEIPTPQPVPEAPVVDLVAIRAQTLTELESAYQLGEEDKELLQTSPELALPKLAAQLHVRMFENIWGAVTSKLPQVIQILQQSGQTQDSAKVEFYKAWPQLADAKYNDVVGRVASVYRQVNPEASLEEAIKATGMQASVMLGFSLEKEPPKQEPTPRPAPPHTPAGRRGNDTMPTQELNEFAALAAHDEFEEN